MMFKTANFLFVGLVLMVATATYVVKYGSEIEYNNIARLEREIQTEKEAIDILKANWSLLTSPSRIQMLSERYNEELRLDIIRSNQVITIDEIPLKPVGIPDSQNAGLQDEGPGVSDVITGSIKLEGGKP